MKLPPYIRNPGRATVILAFLGSAAILVSIQLTRLWRDPDFVFLNDRGGAHWIYHENLNAAYGLLRNQITTGYFTAFNVERAPESAILEVQALKSFRVELDRLLVRDFGPDDPRMWKSVSRIDLRPFLTPGNHRLEIFAQNDLGPTAVWARCPTLGIYSDDHWKTASESSPPANVSLCKAPHALPTSRQFGPAWTHFAHALPCLVPVFILALVFAFGAREEWLNAQFTNRTAHYLVAATVAAVLLLGLNNMFRLDYRYGYDSVGHYKYIDWVAKKWTLPLANDGWQMFQSPLYYLISAPVYAVTTSGQQSISQLFPVRIVSIICGALHPLVCYLFAALVWPDRPRMKIFATLFGGLLPVNIYISQYVGNEPMMSIIGATVLLLGAYILKQDHPPSMKLSIACGVALGLALLTKASALFLVPISFIAFVSRFWGREGVFYDFLKKLTVVAGIAFAISGWYYIRNWVLLGRPFIGGWETRGDVGWWGAPGYRMWIEYARFGRALTYPIYSGFSGTWDGLYSTFWLDGLLSSVINPDFAPQWNKSLLGASSWVALLPSLALVAGSVVPTVRMLQDRDKPWTFLDRLQLFALGNVSLYVGAIVYLSLRVPHYTGAKASYLTACTPLFAFLATRGYMLLRDRGRIAGAVVFAWFACWLFTAYFTYVAHSPVIMD